MLQPITANEAKMFTCPVLLKSDQEPLACRGWQGKEVKRSNQVFKGLKLKVLAMTHHAQQHS
jgi:hypothetical protein